MVGQPTDFEALTPLTFPSFPSPHSMCVWGVSKYFRSGLTFVVRSCGPPHIQTGYSVTSPQLPLHMRPQPRGQLVLLVPSLANWNGCQADSATPRLRRAPSAVVQCRHIWILTNTRTFLPQTGPPTDSIPFPQLPRPKENSSNSEGPRAPWKTVECPGCAQKGF